MHRIPVVYINELASLLSFQFLIGGQTNQFVRLVALLSEYCNDVDRAFFWNCARRRCIDTVVVVAV